MTKSVMYCLLCLINVAMFGCGGVDVGGIPVDASGMTNNFDFGDINVGGIDGLGDAINDTLASETEIDEADADELAERPHPADTDGDFAMTSEELLAYSLAFQDSALPEGQDGAWVDAAIEIWQTRQDGAYYDDMESTEPNNWRPLEGNEIGEPDTDGVDAFEPDEDDGAEAEADESVVALEDEDGGVDEPDDEGIGYDLLVKASSLSVAPVQLSVVDPNGHTNTDWGGDGEIGWASGTAWDGVYTVKVGVGNNWNNVSERITFSVRAYVGGELVHDGEYSAAEGATWDGLTVMFQAP